jgi:hypothetical protein
VREVDWPEEFERAANIAANNPHIQGTWDEEKIEAALRELRGIVPEDEVAGFGALFEELLPERAGGADTPPPPLWDGYDAVTKRGEVVDLGPHRVMCGDSTRPEDVEELMGGEKADFIFTDPPYGHNNNDGDLIHKWEKALGKHEITSSAARPIPNDSPEEAARVFSAFLLCAKNLLRPGGCCCCCCGGGGGPDPQFARWSLEIDRVIGFKHAIVWDKGGLGMGWHYRRCYEMVLVAEKPGGPCHWFGGNDVPNIIRDIGKIIPSAVQHPTEKPVELPEWFIRLHSQVHEIVFDPFLGSGTTLIACENLGRRCFGMEIEPRYCDMAIVRWLRHVGEDKYPELAIRYDELLRKGPPTGKKKSKVKSKK